MDIIKFLLYHDGISALINGRILYPYHRDYNNPLIAACEYGHLDVVKLLVSLGESLHSCNSPPLDTSYLEAACKKEHTHIVRYLLSQKGFQDNMLANVQKLDCDACLLCCNVMEEFGLPIMNYMYHEGWEHDWSQLEEYDCLTVNAVNFKAKKFFFDTHSNGTEYEVNVHDLHSEFRVLLSVGMMEVVMAKQVLPKLDSETGMHFVLLNTNRDGGEHLWALLEMGTFDPGSIFFENGTTNLFVSQADFKKSKEE